MVNLTTLGFPAVGGPNVDGVQSSLSTDPALIDELQKLAYAAYGHCQTVPQIQAVTAEIESALAENGLPTNGPLIDFVNQCAAEARRQLSSNGSIDIGAANGPTLIDPNLVREVETLATEAFGACQTFGQVAEVMREIGGALNEAGLPNSGPLVDYLSQLATAAAQRIAPSAT